MPRSPANPRTGRPRSRRASRTAPIDTTSSGAKARATVMATPASYSTAGRHRSSRYGLASELAAPKHRSTTARRRPSTSAWRTASTVTGPPTLTPRAQDGSGTWGRVTSTWPGSRLPNTTTSATRRAITTSPRRRNTTRDRDHGASVRRADTTKATTAPTSSSRIGLVVRDAAPAMQAAHSHHAPGWRPRRPGAVRMARLTVP